MVVIWIPTIVVFNNPDTWQLVISTITSILAFLLVALLQNSQRRNDVALRRKIDALTEAIALMVTDRGIDAPQERPGADPDERLRAEAELRAAIGTGSGSERLRGTGQILPGPRAAWSRSATRGSAGRGPVGLGGRDTQWVVSIGSGKSAIYQLAGMLLPGLVIVVSPLIALQRAGGRSRHPGSRGSLLRHGTRRWPYSSSELDTEG